jgi:hypothetical protein
MRVHLRARGRDGEGDAADRQGGEKFHVRSP